MRGDYSQAPSLTWPANCSQSVSQSVSRKPPFNNLKLLFIVVYVFLFASLPAWASVVNQEWAATYNGVGNGEDSAMKIKVDASDNVYVAGYGVGNGTREDYTLIKYDKNGNQLWVATYNGPANSVDVIYDMTIDSNGNIYVTGYSYGTGQDYATIKYDTNGNQLWVARYNGIENGNDTAHSIDVDSYGNIYVTGYSGSSYNISTVKYDSSGNQLWVANHSGGWTGNYLPGSKVDPSGNVYVFGHSAANSGYYDYLTVKYDTNGNQLWDAYYNGTANNFDDASSIAVDTLGNAYVTGRSRGSGNYSDITTVKYDTNGNQRWVARYDPGGSQDDGATSIAVDSSGNVYVLGMIGGVSGNSIKTIKYDTNGNQLWVATGNTSGASLSSSGGPSITLDSNDNIYTTSEYIIKYDPSGTQQWQESIGMIGRSMAIGPDRGIYVTGTQGSYSYSDIVTKKYVQSIDLPRTGQTTCYDSAGAVIACGGTGQDGEIQAGVPWPEPRFTGNGDGTVTDNLTGLMWTKDANLMASRDPGFDTDGTSGNGAVTWQKALDYVKKLNAEAYLGHNDWRLPNIYEIEILVDAERWGPALPIGHPFINVQEDDYWSSTSRFNGSPIIVFMGNGRWFTEWNLANLYVWPVRSGQSGVIQLPRTGQTTCYDSAGAVISCAGTGQDGEIQAGVPSPDPRFTDNGDGTVTDNFTGLMWTKDANLPGTSKTWQQALSYVIGMNAGTYLNFGHTDWRLPNWWELAYLYSLA